MLKIDTPSSESRQRHRQNEWQRRKRQSSARVGERFECHCGAALIRKSGSHKFCDACASSRGASYSRGYRQRKFKRAAKTATCVRCCSPIIWFRSLKKYCDDCRRCIQRDKVRARYDRRMKSTNVCRVGENTTCGSCGVQITKTSPRRRFCLTCQEDRTKRRNRINGIKFTRSPQRRLWAKGYRSQPRIFLSGRMRAGINRSLAEKKNGRSWERLVGYSISDLIVHLERQFLPGMTWDNRDQWHVDHIVPLSAFTFTTAIDPEFRVAWAITNLRPLWGPDNLQKRDARIFLL